MAIVQHDAYRQDVSNHVTFAAAGGTSAQSNAFGAQTYFIRIVAAGVASATSGVRYAIGTNPTASATTTYLPTQWVEVVKVTPGQKIAVLSNDTITGALNVTELTD